MLMEGSSGSLVMKDRDPIRDCYGSACQKKIAGFTMASWTMPSCELSLAEEAGKPSERGMVLLGFDQLLAVLQHLPIQSVIAFGMTCKRYKAVADTDALWALICRREWGSRAVDAWPSAGRQKFGWKRLYQQMRVLNAVAWRGVQQGDLVPVPRASHSMSFVNGHLIVFGGGCYGGRHLGDSWIAAIPEYPAEGIVWQQMHGEGPSGRFGQCCCVVGNNLAMFGGIDDKGTRLGDTWISREVAGNEEEKPAWQLLEVVAAPAPRGAHAGCFAGDRKAVIFGGIAADGTRLGDTWVLDLAEASHCWREVVTPFAPRPRSGHTLTWLGGKRMILFGGRGVDFEVMNDVWMLDMESDYPTWVELQACEHDSPAPRAGHSATLIFGERILIFGGEDSRRAKKRDVWVLDPKAGTEVAQNTPCCGSVPRNGAIANSNTSKCSRRFWKRLHQLGRLPSRRSFHAACAVETGHLVLIFGGMVDGERKPAASAGLGFDAELLMLQLVP